MPKLGIPTDQLLDQGAKSRFDKAEKALDRADDLFPGGYLEGSTADIREAIKSFYIAAENLAELLAYRKMMGVD